MAKNLISRTIFQTIMEVLYVDEQNETKETELHVFGAYDDKEAQNVARRMLGTQRAIVRGTRHMKDYCTMTLEEFYNNASSKKNHKEW